jgi:hypothetical protein
MKELAISLIISITTLLVSGGLGIPMRGLIGTPCSILIGIGITGIITSYASLYTQGKLVTDTLCWSIFILGFCNWVDMGRQIIEARSFVGARSLELLTSKFIFFLLVFLLPLIPLLDAVYQANPQDSFDKLFVISQSLYKNMPIDNILPAKLAYAALNDTYQSPLIGDWLGSDRPPLQSGLIIICYIISRPLGIGWDLSSFSSSVASNSLWVVGACAFVSSLQQRKALIYLALVPTALSGYIILNTTFTWPKALSAALLLGSLAISLNKRSNHGMFMSMSCVGLLLGFSCLAHGSSFFAVPGIVVISQISNKVNTKEILARPKDMLKRLSFLLLPFALIQIPWIIWQKAIDPPGNRLSKWHLAGVINIDDTTFFESLVSQYQQLSPWEIISYKAGNFMTLIGTEKSWMIWNYIFQKDYKSAIKAEFFVHSAAITTW